jgi:hypothetical protein
MKSKVILFLCVLLGAAPVALFVWYRWDSAQNRGYEFGYYGVLNKVNHALVTIPSVATTRQLAVNKDIGLEEFTLGVTMKSGQVVALSFLESDPIRRLSGERLTSALEAQIQKQLSLLNDPK